MSSQLLADIIQAAQTHGEESAPDMEVGDLQEALSICWSLLPKNARQKAHLKLAEQNALICSWMEHLELP